MSSRSLLFFLWLSVSLAFTSSANAQERIIRFDSVIEVFEDNSLVVTETIKIRSEGDIFKRGIVRTFPLTRRLPNQKRLTRVGFDILSVEKDGRPEPYHTESGFHSIDIYVGQSDVFLLFGREYTYTLKYRTTKQIGFFEDFDELYWNVNGNGWALDFDEITATVILPSSVRQQVISTSAYTGYEGDTGSDFEMTRTPEGNYRWQVTRRLQPYEGITVALSWPIGVIQRPTEEELAHQVFLGELGNWVLSIGALLIAIYYAFFWFKVGIDPRPGTIFPLFRPPQNLSPAAVRYVRKMGWDNKAFSAAILGAASRGWITISQTKKEYTLERKGSATVSLPLDEKAGFDSLLGARSKIELDQKNHSTFSSAQRAIEKVLKAAHNKVHFNMNTGYVAGGVFLSLGVTIATLILMSLYADVDNDSMFAMYFIAAAGFFVIPFQLAMFQALKKAWVEPGIWSILGALFVSIFALPMGVLYLVFLFGFSWEISQTLFIGLIIIFVVNAVFGTLMKARTPEGRKLLDEIEGFRMFLRATEQDRLEFLHPPDRTPELFEQYLPYAVALDVENRWADQFSSVFKQLEQSGQGEYRPSYYRGSMTSFSAANFSREMGSRLTSSLSSASSSPSSGSSGGGSSGGGGGGGGGGGW
jgi:uncharacterized membrane protein YgcG